MAQIEDQRILVWCNKEKNIQPAIIDAVYLAIKLEKEVCLFANYNIAETRKKFFIRITKYAEIIKKDFPELNVSTLLLQGKLPALMNELGEKYNSIMLCCGTKFTNKLLSAFYESGFPFLFSRPTQIQDNRFKKIIIPIDCRNKTKDATLWGSYMGRFNRSELILHVANDSDPESKLKIAKIVAFIKKFYGQFIFNYWFQTTQIESIEILNNSVSINEKFDLLIYTGNAKVLVHNKTVNPIEKSIINKTSTPVLLINPEKDMYVLCN